ncbi:hypothetical protein MMC28_009587 [Mycoblastus sanguinarius]|nr:hypothetical protein [Mycoblastus sanguinarius]
MLSGSALCFIVSIWEIHMGLGLSNLSVEIFESFLKGLFIGEFCWAASIFTVKYSILAFYWRLFSKLKGARIAIRVLLAVVTCWAIAAVLITAFQCRPVAAFWDISLRHDATCQNSFWSYLISSLVHVITDLAILVLPIPLIWKLQMNRSQKLLLSAIFALGGLAAIISIVRLVYVSRLESWKPETLTEILSETFVWSSIEVDAAVFCSCLPSLRPLLKFIAEKFAILRKRKSQHKRGSELLMDMLPSREQPGPVLPLARFGSRASNRVPSLIYDRTVRELEDKERLRPEIMGLQRCEMRADDRRLEGQTSRARKPPIELEAGLVALEMKVAMQIGNRTMWND